MANPIILPRQAISLAHQCTLMGVLSRRLFQFCCYSNPLILEEYCKVSKREKLLVWIGKINAKMGLLD